MIKNLLTAQNFSMPAGYVTEEGVDFLVRVVDKPETMEELINMPLMDLHMDGVPVITLGEVADVFYTDNSADSYTNVNGSVGCMLTIQKQTGYSTGEVSDLLAERFDEMMDEDMELISIYYGADTTEEAAEEFRSKVEEKYPSCDVELQYGGQPIYYYIVSVE